MCREDDANPALAGAGHPFRPINPQFTLLPPPEVHPAQQGGDDEHTGPLTLDEITHSWSHKQSLHSAFTGATEALETKKPSLESAVKLLLSQRKPLHLVCYTGPLLIHCSVGKASSGLLNKRQKGNIETDQNHRIAECL